MGKPARAAAEKLRDRIAGQKTKDVIIWKIWLLTT